jgi:NAD(P)-dependent dehydrogenase (short-subunit alcohol dehydrogenase family)
VAVLACALRPASPTTARMSKFLEQLPSASGTIAVITGANSGIGFEAARALAGKHAEVILACRSAERGREARERILREHPSATLELVPLDLASLDSVRQFAEALQARPRIDLLINNAGLMAIPRQTTREGFEMQFGVNHLAHFALTGRLLPQLMAAEAGRVVNVSSQAHAIGRMHWDDLDGERRYRKWGAYGQSKLANLLFTFELDRRLRAKHAKLRAVAAHPGYAATNLQYVGPQQAGSKLVMALMRIGNRFMAQPAESGAWPTLYAALSPAAHGGEYFGPSGLGGRAGLPVAQRARAAAYDSESQRKLWEISVARTGVTFAELD